VAEPETPNCVGPPNVLRSLTAIWSGLATEAPCDTTRPIPAFQYRTRGRLSGQPLILPLARSVKLELFDRFDTLEDEIEPLETALQDTVDVISAAGEPALSRAARDAPIVVQLHVTDLVLRVHTTVRSASCGLRCDGESWA
jgi:hypothetical protein